MADLFKSIANVEPNVLSGWVAQWAGLFKGTLLFPPDASDTTTVTEVAIGTFFAVVATLLCRSWPVARLKRSAVCLLGLAVALIAFDLWARYRLDHPTTRKFSDFLSSAWEISAPLTVVACVLTILFAILVAMPDRLRAGKG